MWHCTHIHVMRMDTNTFALETSRLKLSAFSDCFVNSIMTLTLCSVVSLHYQLECVCVKLGRAEDLSAKAHDKIEIELKWFCPVLVHAN